MPFEKGHPKKGGKTKGTINKITKDQKERIEFVLSLLDETLENDIKKMPEVERVKLWSGLQEYIRPKLQRQEIDISSKEGVKIQVTRTIITNESEP